MLSGTSVRIQCKTLTFLKRCSAGKINRPISYLTVKLCAREHQIQIPTLWLGSLFLG